MPIPETTAQRAARSTGSRRKPGLGAGLVALLATTALAAGGCGAGSSGSSRPAAQGAAAGISHDKADGDTDSGQVASDAPPAASSSAGIPQNNGGDQDQAHAFGWLRPSPPPRSWRKSRLPDGSAQLAYPAGWRAIGSDPGTVTAALRSPSGEIRGYLNATPRQGEETLANWGSFRPDHNGDEGDVDVAAVASATKLPFRNGRGSCVIDTYTSSTGHSYREIACIVAGARATTVVVGAAPPGQWRQQGPEIERAISSFLT